MYFTHIPVVFQFTTWLRLHHWNTSVLGGSSRNGLFPAIRACCSGKAASQTQVPLQTECVCCFTCPLASILNIYINNTSTTICRIYTTLCNFKFLV